MQNEYTSGLCVDSRTISLESLPRYNLESMLVTDDSLGESIAKGGVAIPFPWRLYECLDAGKLYCHPLILFLLLWILTRW